MQIQWLTVPAGSRLAASEAPAANATDPPLTSSRPTFGAGLRSCNMRGPAPVLDCDPGHRSLRCRQQVSMGRICEMATDVLYEPAEAHEPHGAKTPKKAAVASWIG